MNCFVWFYFHFKVVSVDVFLMKKKNDHNVNRIVLTRLNKFEKHGSSHPLDPTKQNIKSIQNKMDKILSNKPSNMTDLKQVPMIGLVD